MRKKGVITVFLSFIFLFFLNFLMTTVEAARISAGRSYIAMLGLNAGRGLESRYYYPLFKEYGLLAVDSGFGGTLPDGKKLENIMNESLQYAEKNTLGGLIDASELSVASIQVKTLVSNDFKAFKEQIKEEAVYEGAELLCSFFTDNSLETVESVTGLQVKQQEAGKATAAVSIEILKMMELVDGVCTTDEGLKTDKKGNYQVASSFAKKFFAKDTETLEQSYGNSVILELVKPYIIDVKVAIENLWQVIQDYKKLRTYVDKESTEIVLEEMYKALYLGWDGSMIAYLEALKQADILERVQKVAQSDVLQYEQELIGSIGIDNEVLAGLFAELDHLKDYVGLNEKGYNAGNIKKNLLNNLNVMQTAALPEIQEFVDGEGEIIVDEMENCLSNFTVIISGMVYDSLRFDYGNLKAADGLKSKLEDTVTSILAGGVFSILGVKDVSEKELEGSALPSKGKATGQTGNIKKLFEEVSADIVNGQLASLLKSGYQNMSMDFLMEVYMKNHFKSFQDPHDGSSRLDYEREYMLFGNKSDEANLLATATRLIALRAVFCFAALMADQERNGEVTLLAESMAVFGVPALVYIAKYLILTVWAIEEAIVEVAALMAGESVPVFNLKGNVKLHELFIFTPELVSAKVKAMGKTQTGVGYDAYIILLSFLQNDGKKYGRALDLIQENIRYRYRDSFRIGNCVCSATFVVKGKIGQKFHEGFFDDAVYEVSTDGAFSY